MPLVRNPIVNLLLLSVCCSLSTVGSVAPGYGTEATAAASHQRAIGDSSKRSLNNYMVSSVPYMVDTKSLNLSSVAMWQLNDFAKDEQPSPYALHDEAVDCADVDGQPQCVKEAGSSSPAENSAEATFRPYSQEELNKILQKYEVSEDMRAQETKHAAAAVLYSGNGQRKDEEPSSSSSSVGGVLEPGDKSKSWNLINSQNFKNPYDDRMGWVTLEPIAWSSSQVQKWEPNQKPVWPPPSQVNQQQQQQQQTQQNSQHWSSGPQQQQLQPSYSWTTDRPWKRPTYQYQQQKPWSGSGPNQNYGGKPPSYGAASSPFGQTQDIITDGQPGYFPQDRPSSQSAVVYNSKPWLDQSHAPSSGGFENYNRPPSSQIVYQGGGGGGSGGAHHPVSADRPPASSLDGDGHWVLLSSTKGYSIPQRQKSAARSLDSTSDGERREQDSADESPPAKSKSSRRTVRLTVLPPLPGSTKTVTSHGGMIEVESTKQTVDEAHREHLARMLRLHQNSTGHPAANEVPAGSSVVSRSRPDSVVGQSRYKRNGLLAAVGAGMIPATMAMLLPLLMGRRKRDSSPAPEVKQPNVVTLNFKKFDRPGIVTRYTRRAGKDRPSFAKSYALYE